MSANLHRLATIRVPKITDNETLNSLANQINEAVFPILKSFLQSLDPRKLNLPGLQSYRLALPTRTDHSVLTISTAFAVLFVLLSLSSFGSRSVTKQDDLRAPLRAILAVVTPTCSTWPVSYLVISRRALLHKPTIKMPLRLILDDVISGAVELRLPAVDLPIFMTNTLQAQGWEMKMDVEASWWYCVISQIVLSYCSNFIFRPFPTPSSLKQTGLAQPTLVPSLDVPHSAEQARTSSEPMLSDTSVVHNSAPRECMMFTLDTIPYARLDAFIRDFQASLSFGTTAMLGFSTCSSSVSFLSTRFVLASIPFLPRRFAASKRSGKTYPSARRTVTPLLTSLDGIVKLLVSGPSPLAIESVQNVSKDYAKYLSRYVQDLTQAPDVRTKFVANWGIEGWREERLLAAWEDALVNIGSLQRWVILVRK